MKCLALLAQTEILGDLLPAYRIREDEKQDRKLTKEVKALKHYERVLLTAYTRLVKPLTKYCRDFNASNVTTCTELDLVVTKCVLRLLERGRHFNLRKDITSVAAPLLNNRDERVRELAYKGITSLFQSDVSGDVTLEVVRILARIIQNKNGRVAATVVKSFVSLPLSQEIIQPDFKAPSASSVAKGKKAKKKQLEKDMRRFKVSENFDKHLENDMRSTSGEVSIEHKRKSQTEVLTCVMTCYFRIIKHHRAANVLPEVLEGLAKFANLVNLELVLDLIACLQKMLLPDPDSTAPPLSLSSSLHCMLTVFQVLKIHGSALSVDVKDFYTALYEILPSIGDPEHQSHLPVLLDCLEMMFAQTKQLSVARIAAFAKRLGSLALCVPPHASLALLHAIRSLLSSNLRASSILDVESSASGEYRPYLQDPELCNALASTYNR